MTYMLKNENIDRENRKSEKNAYVLRRNLLSNNWSQIKTSRIQNFHFFHEFDFLKEHIYVNKETSLLFGFF